MHRLPRLSLATALLAALLGSTGCQTLSPAGKLENIRETTQHRLSELHNAVDQASNDIAAAGLDSPQVHLALDKLAGAQRFVADAALLDADGEVIAVEPGDYHDHADTSLGGRPEVVQVRVAGKGILSDIFMVADDVAVVDAHHPIFGADGEFLGSVRALLHVDDFLEDIITPRLARTPYDVWVLQTDGRVLYSSAGEYTDRIVFLDSMFADRPGWRMFSHRVTQELDGTGSFYTDGGRDGDLVEVCWSTVELHDTDWRIALLRPAE